MHLQVVQVRKKKIPKNFHLLKDEIYLKEYKRLYKLLKIKDIEHIPKFGVVSPKMFEAISVGTVLVMFQGNYSNILLPNIHYIELKKNLSNLNDVVSKISDNNFLQNMADRAYKDIILSRKYDYKHFIKSFDKTLITYCKRKFILYFVENSIFYFLQKKRNLIYEYNK